MQRLVSLLREGGEQSAARRMAGSAFLIRVVSAGIIYLSQIALARWMGQHEFGIYVYALTWLVLLGGLAPLGLAYSAQRFIPEYRAAGDLGRLRGFLAGSRFLSVGFGLIAAAAAAAIVLLLGDRIGPGYREPLLLAAAALPLFALSCAQDGIARSFNWIQVALVPGFVLQPILVLAFVVAAHMAGMPSAAIVTVGASVIAIWLTVALQGVILQRRLGRVVAPGERRYEPKRWFATALPIFMVDGFFFLLTYTDIIVLQLFVAPAEIGVYYAATKTLVLISFIYYAVSAAFAHRFSESHFAGEREKLKLFIAEAIRWTFWPSLAFALVLLALGKPILMLFGAGFADGYPLLFVLVLGLLARASVGPAERLLIMVGEQRLCAAIYAAAFALNLALCFLLVPRIGPLGAAVSTALAIVLESVLLFVMTRRRLGLHVFFWPVRG